MPDVPLTLQQKAQQVLDARCEGDLRYQQFIAALSQRTGVSPQECEHLVFSIAVGAVHA